MNFTWEDPNATAADAAAGPKLPPAPNASKGGAADDAGLAPPPVEAAVPEIAEYSYPLGNASNATANASSDAAMRAGLATKNASVAPGVGFDVPAEGAKKAPAPLPAAAVAPNATAAPLAPAPPAAAKTTAAPAAAKTTPAPAAAAGSTTPAVAGAPNATAAPATTSPPAAATPGPAKPPP